MLQATPVIDLFAGPGGLNEGFEAFGGYGERFDVRLSIESEESAHRTLQLRSFFRLLARKSVPEQYYEYIRGDLDRDSLFASFSEEAKESSQIAWRAELGEVPLSDVLQRIQAALSGHSDHWVLLGGPPCQAYSTMGRARMKGNASFVDDRRHSLYREYMKIVAAFNPTVFVMENVKGLLSSRHQDELIFMRLLSDMRDPWASLSSADQKSIPRPDTCHNYRIYSFSQPVVWEEQLKPHDYVIESERYGVPQRRHRVILLGIRADYEVTPPALEPAPVVTVQDVIGDMPKIRSLLSKGTRAIEHSEWAKSVRGILRCGALPDIARAKVRQRIRSAVNTATRRKAGGRHFIPGEYKPKRLAKWLHDPRIGGVIQHESRSHMASDLHRYMFAANFAREYGWSPKLIDFPPVLWPNHKNAKMRPDRGNGGRPDFNDRFRVQIANEPSTTITAHIRKDGHYFIHPDPTQCRTLTHREAARLQTFPDNYFFEGNRGQRYEQIGNAVPPFLAYQLADIVAEVLEECREQDRSRLNADSNVIYLSRRHG